MFNEFGKLLLITGIIFIFIGLVFIFGHKFFSGGLPKLPGDIFIKKEHVTIYFPIVTCIIISIILTILLNIFFRK